MNIRRFFRLSCLSVMGFFWASCGSDSDTSTGAMGAGSGNEPESSSDVLQANSSDAQPSSSSSLDQPGLDSSADAASSSSAGIASSSSARKYILASDTSVTCVKEKATYSTCTRPKSYSCMELQEFLQKDTSVTAKVLEEWQEKLETCNAIFEPVALYGVFYDPCSGAPTYTKVEMKCSNGSYYSDYKTDGDLVYKTVEEYNQAHGISSSSAVQSSSSAPEDLVKNCPQGDFATFVDVLEEVQKDFYEIIVSGDLYALIEGDIDLSEAGKAYIEGLLDHDKKAFKGPFVPYLTESYESDAYLIAAKTDFWFDGYIAKTETCAGGTTITTERYKKMRQDIMNECFDLIMEEAEAAE